jgi:hypothetical protein
MGAGAKGTPSPASPSHRTFKKILAANRGEIAIRIMRAGVSGKSRAEERGRFLLARHGFPTPYTLQLRRYRVLLKQWPAQQSRTRHFGYFYL